MRAAAILGLGSSIRDLHPFQQESTEWVMGVPSQPAEMDAILIFGGDGTVHRHLSALVKLGLPVLVVPAGSGNDFARSLGLMRVRDSLAAWRNWLAGAMNVRLIDLGLITPIETRPETTAEAAQEESAETARLKACPDTNPIHATATESNDAEHGAAGIDCERSKDSPMFHSQGVPPVFFSCAAGVGLDGEISRRANALPRWLRAHGGYALSLPSALLHFRPFLLKLSVAESLQPDEFLLRSQQPVTAAIFANAPFYGGGMKIAPRAQMDDGQLDTCIIRDIPKLKLAGVFPSVYFGRHLGIREVEYFPIERARVETETPLDVYADGEYVCRTPVEIGVARSCLRVIVPDSQKSGS